MSTRSAVSRILSITCRSRQLCAHLSTAPKRSFRRSEMRHTRDHWTGRPIPYFALHRNGFILPSSLPLKRWALTPPFHPYPSTSSRRFIFCDTGRQVELPRPAPVFTGIPALRCPDFPLTLIKNKRTPTLRGRRFLRWGKKIFIQARSHKPKLHPLQNDVYLEACFVYVSNFWFLISSILGLHRGSLLRT